MSLGGTGFGGMIFRWALKFRRGVSFASDVGGFKN